MQLQEIIDNPADFASKGLNPEQLQDCSVWWQGTIWLQHPAEKWAHNSAEKRWSDVTFRMHITAEIF